MFTLKVVDKQEVEKQEVEKTESKVTKSDNGLVVVELQNWVMESQKLPSRFLEGRIVKVSDNGGAVLFDGNVVVGDSDNCMRCGKPIEDPVSRKIGYGPECIKVVFSDKQIRSSLEDVIPPKVSYKWLPTSSILIDGFSKKQDENRFASVTGFAANKAGRVTITKGEDYWQGKAHSVILVKGDSARKVCTSLLRDHRGSFWSRSKNAFVFPFDIESSTALVKAFGELADIDQDVVDMASGTQTEALKTIVSDGKKNDDIPVTVNDPPPWNHQKIAFWFSKELEGSMLALDMGAGKTRVAVDLMVNTDARSVLILCPKSVIQQWKSQIEKWGDGGFYVDTLDNVTGKARKEESEMSLVYARSRGDRCVLITSYHAACRDPFASWSLKRRWDLVVLDESHRIKAPRGVISTYCGKLGKVSVKRLALTGMPMPHSPLDLWAQYRFIAPGIFGNSFTAFRDRYAVVETFPGGEIIKKFKNLDELYRMMYQVAYRVTKRDVLDLPPTNSVDRICHLEPSALKVYKQMEKDFYAGIEDGSISASNVLVRGLRLQQITGGSATSDDGRLLEVSRAKAELFEDVIEDLPVEEPIVVFCRFRHDIAVVTEIAKKTGRRVSELSGSRNTLKEWQDGKTDLIAVQIRSGGEGIDLSRSAYSIYYSLGFSLGDYEQSRARTDRPGQTRPTTFIHLIADNTIDRRIYEVISQRKEPIEALLEGRV